MPHLNPISTVSETKLTMAPALAAHETMAITPTSSARPMASAANRCGSPPARSPSEVPTRSEMAEVAATAVCRELQNTQYTSPPNRQA